MNVLLAWWNKANSEERAAMAERARTTVPALRMLAHSYKTGGVLQMSAEMAGRLEKASAALHEINPALPVLFRGDLCPACARCPYAQLCATGKEEK